MKKKFFPAFGVILAMSVLLAGCKTTEPETASVEEDQIIAAEDIFGDLSTQTEETPAEVDEVEAEPAQEVMTASTVSIVAVGDTLASNGTHKSGAYPDGTYNYDHIFAHTKDVISAADLAIVNEEVMLGGVELGLTGYPLFNAAYELGDSIAAAGFDVILLASNHTIDKGEKGFDNCINFWRTNYPEIGIVGVNQTEEEVDDIYVTERGGITFAILNYTYGLNGLRMPSDRQYMVNLLEEDRVISDLKKADELADFVIVCPHWGTEYVYYATDYQKYWAQIFADYGADLIVGTHPHVIEPVEWITGSNGNQCLCYYSLGNFSSNQNKAPRMLGAIMDVKVTSDEHGVYISEYGVIPIINHENWSLAGLTTYLMSDYTEELSRQNAILNNDSSWSLSFAQSLCEKVFGDLYTVGNRTVFAPEYSTDYGTDIEGTAPSGEGQY